MCAWHSKVEAISLDKGNVPHIYAIMYIYIIMCSHLYIAQTVLHIHA